MLPAVVSIKVNRVRAFDTVGSGSVQAAGFVVDKARAHPDEPPRGGPGPGGRGAIFVNNEEVPLSRVYYDPVTPRAPPRAHARARARPRRASAGARAALPVAVRTAATRPAHPLAGPAGCPK